MNEVPSAARTGELAGRVASLTKTSPRSWSPVTGGYTGAGRWVVRNSDGSSCFVKAATDENTAEWLRAEMAIYGGLSAEWLPEVLGWDDDGERPLLLLEDLSGALWPPLWSEDLVERVPRLLELVHATSPPNEVPPLGSAPKEAPRRPGSSRINRSLPHWCAGISLPRRASSRRARDRS